MDRRKFIKNSCVACLSASVLAEMVSSCTPSRYIKGTMGKDGLFVDVNEFVEKMCLMEGAEAGYATASGMSAVFGSFMALLKQGDHLLCCNAIFGSTHTVIAKYLPKFGY